MGKCKFCERIDEDNIVKWAFQEFDFGILGKSGGFGIWLNTADKTYNEETGKYDGKEIMCDITVDGINFTQISTPIIKYCPFCGRKLVQS
jgi:hypothetical protein